MTTTKKRSRNKRRRRKRNTFGMYRNYILAGGVLLIILVVIVLGIKGCGVNHKSPEGVVEDLVKAGVDGNEKDMQKCYDLEKKIPEELKTEVDATIEYYKAHNANEVKIDRCEVLFQNKKYAYVYIRYNLILENKQEYPCIATYMVKEKDKKYYVLAPSEITEEMSETAVSEYAKFMTTDIYKDYVKAYDIFIKKNPGYEEKIAGKLA